MKGVHIILLLLTINIFHVAGSGISLIPEPYKKEILNGEFILSPDTKIQTIGDVSTETVNLFNDFLYNNHRIRLKNAKRNKNVIQLIVDKEETEEAYRLIVTENSIKISGKNSGIFYGLQTLQQLMNKSNKESNISIRCLNIEDKPRFSYRGLMLDVGRYFYPIDYLKTFIDLMAQYKLNVFHWHLTEDAGWRIEIKKYPELTSKGAWRSSTQSGKEGFQQDKIPHGGFYTQEQVREIITYAQKRQVMIIPEIEMPGHSMAALSTFPSLSCSGGPFAIPLEWGVKEDIFCAGNEDVYKFLENVLEEIIDLFPSPYIHIGGDEAPKKRWKACPKCQSMIKKEKLKDEAHLQSYFIQRIQKYVNSKGKQIIGWDEILEGGLAPNATVMSWRGEAGGINAANMGHNVIMSPNNYLYFDYYQSDTRDLEPAGAHWAPSVSLKDVYNYEPFSKKISTQQKQFIKGIQANLWGEKIHGTSHLEYMAYPRTLALSEVAWSPEVKKDYHSFLKRLPARLKQLDEQGVTFRIPEADGGEEAEIKNGFASISLRPLVENSKIYYTTDGSNPSVSGTLYSGSLQIPLSFSGILVKYIIVLPSGRSSAVYTVSHRKQ